MKINRINTIDVYGLCRCVSTLGMFVYVVSGPLYHERDGREVFVRNGEWAAAWCPYTERGDKE